jgi:hypothetical protein
MYSNFIGTFTKSGYVNEETQKNGLAMLVAEVNNVGT